MKDIEYLEIIEFLKEKTPLILDMEKEDIRYDERSMYYRIYKYIHNLREENKKLKERK